MSGESRLAQFNFSRGEISPLLHAHVDLDMYRTALGVCENWLPLPHGVLTARPGTRFCGMTKYNDKKCRLERFVFARNDAYCLEIGHLYIRFWRDQGRILDSDDAIYEVTTPFTDAQVFDLSIKQNDNDLYFAHQDHPPQILTRNDHADWTFSPIEFTAKPSEWVEGNYPRIVGFIQQRLGFSGTPNERKTFWFSRMPDNDNNPRFSDFTIGTLDTDGLKFSLTDEENGVEWMSAERGLAVGTSGSTRIITGTNPGDPITAASINDQKQTGDGVSNLAPLSTSRGLLFMGKSGRRLHQFKFDLQADSFISPDITEASEHITVGGVRDAAFAQDPHPIAWLVRGDGQLIGCTYMPEQNVIAWHRHTLGGATEDTSWGCAESVAVTPKGAVDVLYIAVKRVVDGETVRMIECLEQVHRPAGPDDREGMFHVDAGGTYTGDSVGTVGGAEHLKGEALDILADGAAQPRVVVQSDGSFTMANQNTAGAVSFGLPYRSHARTLRPTTDPQTGLPLGRKVSVKLAAVDVQDTASLALGADEATATEINFRRAGDPYGKPPPLMTGDVSRFIDSGFNADSGLSLVARGPVCSTIRALAMEVRTGL
ncbi:MAG: hypothetical protein QNJ84_18970 [Alphaproteobacteria bacterium]|nr:hypothetical protein [Alphaproteobacteria bacterium]